VDELLSKERNIDLLLMGKKWWVENGETSRKEDRVWALTTSTQWNFKVPSPIIINLNNLFWLRRL